MSPSNVEVVRGVVDSWNRGDTASRAGFHPDVEWLPLRAATEGGYRGVAGLDDFVADTLDVFDRFELHFELADVGGRVLAWGSIHVRTRGSGIETDIPSGGLFDLRDGEIVRWQDFGSKDAARNVATAQRAIEAWNGLDLEGFMETWHDEAEWRPAFPKGTEGTGGVFRGREGIRRGWDNVRAAWSEYRVDVETARMVGEDLLVLGSIHARGKSSDIAVDSEWSAVVRYRDGVAIRAWDWLDHEAALAAVGVAS